MSAQEHFTSQGQSVDYDGARWVKGTPDKYVDSVTFPRVAADKPYGYRVMRSGWGGDQDYGIKPSYEVQPGGAQKVNLLEYNAGYGIDDSATIKIYVVDPDSGNQYLAATWN